ncbi:MAG: amino acid ABC transporter substrate-binding protein [Acidimicrobiia bacterium]|nr:amino acid ABC transporter substrate-binding protein [Acidimicrobiia bacterium]MDH4306258.1 amino acid ABC transporter substrate-binding protein [Acidimicrobiia bacterium]MDH5292414.1 amino acid ABC transporter substrate-binding protein [Acidimicrobiia bacterium]
MFKRHGRAVALLAALTLILAACTSSDDGGSSETTAGETETTAAASSGGSVLAAVQDRGKLNCGVNNGVPGFGFVDESGEHVGFDIDYCKAVAAAVLGDADAVEYVDLDAQQRFTALQSGEIDVLIRNTTWTATRDGSEGATFLHTTFYDGQGMMVKADAGIASLDDMANTSVCVQSGTTTELNLASRFDEGGIPYTPLTFAENPQIQEAFIAGQCEGWTSDKSQLAGLRSNWPEDQGGPEALVILDETFSKEPLGPVVRDGDSQWAQIIDWITLATITAEELGIDSSNVGSFGDTESTEIRRLLGLEITGDDGATSVFDPGLGLEPGWVVDVISAVGNYGEIFDRNLGSDTPLGLTRGVNALWTDGGLLYAPPYR